MTPRRHVRRSAIAHAAPSRYLDVEPIIICSARKHGTEDADMLHAWRNAWSATGPNSDGLVFVIGPAQDGTPLELGLIESSDFNGVLLIHAMPARRRFLER